MVLDEHNFLGTHTQYMSVSCVCVCLDKKHTYNNTHTYCCCSARSCVLVIIRNAFDILFAAGLVSILYIYLTCYLFVLLPLAQLYRSVDIIWTVECLTNREFSQTLVFFYPRPVIPFFSPFILSVFIFRLISHKRGKKKKTHMRPCSTMYTFLERVFYTL